METAISGKFDRSSSGPLRKDKPIKMDDLGLFLRNHISIKVPLLKFREPCFLEENKWWKPPWSGI